MDELVADLAKQYSLDPAWVGAIITQESQWNPYAIRYEPNYAYLYQLESFAKNFLNNLNTETVAQRISWGLGQIMGGLAREQGHHGLMASLLNPAINIRHICIRLTNLKKISALPDDVFCMYNAGPGGLKTKTPTGLYMNQAYVNSVKDHIANGRICKIQIPQ